MRQYLATDEPDKNGFLVVQGKDFKYLRQVLRLKIGERILVRLPNQQLVLMEVEKIQAKQLIFAPLNNEKCENLDLVNVATNGVCATEMKNNNINYWIFQFVPKPQKMDILVRQCVECGVKNIVPVSGEFSLRQDWENRSNRWNRIVKEARQQSGSPVNTKLFDCINLSCAIELWQKSTVEQNRISFVLHESDIATKTLHFFLRDFLGNSDKSAKLKDVALAIGPEGGMSRDEVDLLKSAGFNLIHFNTNILRCETACLYGIAAVQNAISEYEIWHTSE